MLYQDQGSGETLDYDTYTPFWSGHFTTYSPCQGSWPDVNFNRFDLGYHYPVNEDSDHDGLPDAWEWKWFGNCNHVGSDLDANRNTFLHDFQNSIDPNISRFSIGAANDYVNTTTASVQLDVAAGVPSYYAIFAGSATTTNWLPFTTTNLTVNLGSTDGVYPVHVGLRGLPADAQQTWAEYEFFLDRVAPVLTITNPILAGASATVIKPYLQLKGFANEELATYSCAVSNVTGVSSNLNVSVIDRFFDTNRFDFTTNYFQCYDVPLAGGSNWLTLCVTDRAGNTTTTNFNVTLDYTSATTPPVVKLIWPQNGMALSGTACTIRGTLSDETGTIEARVINGDGTISTNSGIVERNNMFWVENVRLNGNSQITVRATDAAGNVTTTNFTVQPSTFPLAINSTPTGDDLYKPKGTVAGTVGDPAATVTVNGVTAMVDTVGNGSGSYNWTASNVSNYGQGTATFDAQAVSAGGQAAANSSKEKEPYWTIVNHSCSKTYSYRDNSGQIDHEFWDKNYSAQAHNDGDGKWYETYHGDTFSAAVGVHEGSAYSVSSVYTWSDTNPNGTETDKINGELAYEGPFLWNSYLYLKVIAQPDIDQVWGCATCGPTYQSRWMHHYRANGVKYHWDWQQYGEDYGEETVTVGAMTEVKLYTGGKASVSRQNLFGIYASADKYSQPPGTYSEGIWWNTPTDPLDPTSLTVAGKHPGTNGMVWTVLPDNSEQDITVKAPGVKHYDAGAGATKYKSYFEVFVDQPDPTGHLIWTPSAGPGHAWWRISTEAPGEAVDQFNIGGVNLEYLGVEVGYGPLSSLWDHIHGLGTAPGQLPWPNSHSPNVTRKYSIDFMSILSGLSYTETVHASPGTYSVPSSTCTSHTIEAGAAVGVGLPNDTTPENLGFDLSPSN